MIIPDPDNHPNRMRATALRRKWICKFSFRFKLEFAQGPCHGPRRGRDGVPIETWDRYHKPGCILVIDPRIEPTLCQTGPALGYYPVFDWAFHFPQCKSNNVSHHYYPGRCRSVRLPAK
jgi:hypothetical protein